MTEPTICTLRLRVVRPWWLSMATTVLVIKAGVTTALTGREMAEAEVTRFGEWYGRQLRIVTA